METRTLPHTDLTVSRACFGTMTFDGQTGEAAAACMVDLCLERGVNFFDTANSYTGGQSETILGKILKGRRGRVVLASKVGIKAAQPIDAPPLSRRSILANIDATLERLQTDYLDIYYLHLPDYETPLEETIAALDEVVKAGKVRYPASSNFAAWQVCRMLCLAERNGQPAPYLSQPMYNLLARGIEQEYLPFCQQFGVSTIVYNPLAGGMLTGKQRRDQPLPGTRFDSNQLYLDRYWHPGYFDAVEQLRETAAQAGRTLVELALGWVLHHTAADCAILGASTVEQLEQNLDACERGPLPEGTAQACDRVWQNLRGVTPRYNR